MNLERKIRLVGQREWERKRIGKGMLKVGKKRRKDMSNESKARLDGKRE